ncbi:RICIN domain-containing protein, partial [Kitasatospora sp. NPDC002965]|uniref:RICIN domain-containing protein n=1 Tax=Kitasatospora sp. NPDC002965 TaxID=3154775 RepID=UPI0033A43F14
MPRAAQKADSYGPTSGPVGNTVARGAPRPQPVAKNSRSPAAPTETASGRRTRQSAPDQGAYETGQGAWGTCLDVEGGSTADGARLILWPCGPQADQHWTVASVSTGSRTSPTQWWGGRAAGRPSVVGQRRHTTAAGNGKHPHPTP